MSEIQSETLKEAWASGKFTGNKGKHWKQRKRRHKLSYYQRQKKSKAMKERWSKIKGVSGITKTCNCASPASTGSVVEGLKDLIADKFVEGLFKRMGI